MKKFLAILLSCMLMTMVAAPVAAFAAGGDTFVGSVEQETPVDQVPDPGEKAPQTGEAFPVVPVAGAVFFAAAAVGLFAVAGQKQKS
ncbi:MAG: hypothetical protein Q4F24_15375 [Eubacteriales bacterium]|nr:hypothetical protein [Eubacteriales bacterium]